MFVTDIVGDRRSPHDRVLGPGRSQYGRTQEEMVDDLDLGEARRRVHTKTLLETLRLVYNIQSDLKFYCTPIKKRYIKLIKY